MQISKKVMDIYDDVATLILDLETTKQIQILYDLPMKVLPRKDGLYFVQRGYKIILAVDSLEKANEIKNNILAIPLKPDYLIYPKSIKNKEKPKPHKLNIKLDYVYGDIYLSEIRQMPYTTQATKQEIIKRHLESYEESNIIEKEYIQKHIAELEEKLKDDVIYNVTAYFNKHYRRITYYNPIEQKRKQSTIGDVFIAVVASNEPIKVISRTPQKSRKDKISNSALRIRNEYFTETKY